MKKLFNLFLIFTMVLTFSLTAQDNGSFKLPEYEKFTLDNGLTVYLMEQHEVPLVYLSYVFPAGYVNDGEKCGLASLTSDAILFGTKNYTKQQIQEKLDFIGASYGAFATAEFTGLNMSFINSDQDKVFPILKDIVTNPTFPNDEFEKRKTRLLTELTIAKERPSSVIASYYDKFIYGDHPYGNPGDGTKTSVEKITNEDVRAFYKKNYLPAGSAIALVGDFNTAEMKNKIEKLFGDWNVEGSVSQNKIFSKTGFDKSRVLLVNKDDARETQFYIGGLGIKRSNPDYTAIQVINTILGGRFTSWLNDELRVNRGLTYGARSSFNSRKHAGTFVVRSYTATKNTEEALDVSLQILDKLHNQGIDEKTLLSAKNYVKGQYPPRYETAGSLAGLLTQMFIYDFNESFINDFQENVDKLTTAKAKEVIAKYFPKENLQMVLIGKASEIKKIAEKYGEVTVKEIKTDGY